MDKIKINKKIFEKGKLVLITTVLGTSLLLNGCGTFGISNTTHDNSYNGSYSSDYQNKYEDFNATAAGDMSTDFIPMSSLYEGERMDTVVNFSNNNYLDFKKGLEQYEVDYKYEYLYDFDSALKEYNKLNLTDNHNIKLHEITADNLYNLVLSNNEEYKKVHTSSIYKILDTADLKNLCNIIADTVNDFISSNSDISVERIKCVLSNLKMFKQTSSVSNAYISTDDCFIISPNMLQIAQMINGKGTEKDVFIHEVMHLLQKGCACDLNKNPNLDRNYGFGYKFKNLKLNPLDLTWMYESSAEKNMINYTGHEPLVYKNMIGYLESLSIVNILNDSYKVNDTEKLTFKRSLDDLYSFFGATTEAEKKEVLNLMYSIEIMQKSPEDFYEMYEKSTGKKKDSTVVDDINYTLKPSICLTLTKYFYNNLAKNIVNKEVTKADIFYLITLFENDLNNHILYNNSSKYDYNEEFIQGYVNIQNDFFYQLSIALNCTQEQIVTEFLNYAVNINENGVTKNNCSLKFLSNQKVLYLKERQNALKSQAAPSVYSVYNSLQAEKKH